MSGFQRARAGRATGRATRLVALLAALVMMVHADAGARAASCPAGAGPPERVLSRLPIRARLTAAFALAMVLVLAAAAWFVYVRLEANLNELRIK